MIRYLQWIALSALLAGPAAAASPTFSYLDLAYVRTDDSAEGGDLRASAALGSRMFIQLDANVRDHLDGTIGHVALGTGLHWPVADGFEVAFALSANLVGGSFEGPDDSGMDGVELGAGASLELRARPGPRVELNAGAKFESVTDQFIPSAGARFYFSRRVAVGLRMVHDYFDTRAELALHLNFGD